MMGGFNVNIFIETLGKGPAKGERAGEWLVEFVKGNGDPVTRSGIIWRKNVTENAFVLELLKEALTILTKPCSIRVITCCGHVKGMVNTHLIDKWAGSGWINAKGELVKNEKLWQQVHVLMKPHSVKIISDENSYRLVMRNDIREEMDRHHEE